MKDALVCAAVTLVATVAASAAAGAAAAGLVAGVAAGIVAGAVVFLLGREQARPPVVADTRLQDAVAANSQLRHDLRGALSPALLVSDRLIGHADAGVAKAGNTVVRAVQRATELLETNKQDDSTRLSPPAR